jgi:hypothetical protein
MSGLALQKATIQVDLSIIFPQHIRGGTVESRKEARLTCARNVAANP